MERLEEDELTLAKQILTNVRFFHNNKRG